ncbi:hypothetical protein [Geodermatophilus sp. CPCC 205761]|uniref:hypothetical protein n=1 Tax=Geodermatophilus sp. CPCC 205761 TaxID=2936597 RepID=UPI003EEAB641
MSREIPQAIRAVAGLTATVLDEVLRLPRTLPGLPVRVIGLAMQATMKLQQHYTGLVARGDEVFTGLRGEQEPGLATFDEDLPASANGNGLRTSAFDRAADVVPDEEVAEEVAALIDDEVSGLPPEPAPEEVVEALQDITDEVTAADLRLVEPGLTTEDALETALLEADGAPDSALVDGGTADAGLVDADDIAESPAPVTEADAAPGEDVAADVATDIDVLTPDGGIATVEGTVTDEGVAAPETPETGPGARTTAAAHVVTDHEARVDEALGSEASDADSRPGTGVAEATPGAGTTSWGDEVVTPGGERVDDALGGADGEDGGDRAPAGDAGSDTVVATDESGTPVAEATGGGDGGEPGAAPVDGYDSMTIAQLRGRLRGYQPVTVRDLLSYEEATRARPQYLTMLRNRLEKIEQEQAG